MFWEPNSQWLQHHNSVFYRFWIIGFSACYSSKAEILVHQLCGLIGSSHFECWKSTSTLYTFFKQPFHHHTPYTLTSLFGGHCDITDVDFLQDHPGNNVPAHGIVLVCNINYCYFGSIQLPHECRLPPGVGVRRSLDLQYLRKVERCHRANDHVLNLYHQFRISQGDILNVLFTDLSTG